MTFTLYLMDFMCLYNFLDLCGLKYVGAISREPWHPPSNALSQCRQADKHGRFYKIGSVFHKNEFHFQLPILFSLNYKQLQRKVSCSWTFFVTFIITHAHN